jgi:hypothetical protein
VVQEITMKNTDDNNPATTAAPESTPHHARRKAKKRKTATRRPKPSARRGSKKAAVLTMLRKAEGATLSEIMKATGWQSHSVRGFLSGTLGKAMSLQVESSKRADGERTYRLKN